MLLDVTRQIHASFLLKSITVEKMLVMLLKLPRGAWLIPNQVGNLGVYIDGIQIGYIDITMEEFVEEKS